MKYKTKDNLLTKEQHDVLHQTLVCNTFPWYYHDSIVTEGDNYFHFNHMFYLNGKPNSAYTRLVEPLLKKIKFKKLLNVRSNLFLRDHVNTVYPKHKDYEYKHKVLLYYVNSTNGGTLLDEKVTIKCKKNRGLFMDGDIWHSPITQTNTKYRVVVNIGYIE
jgi:hypothetical protein